MHLKLLHKPIAVALAITVMVSLVFVTGAGAHGAWPYVKTQIAASVSGDSITYTVWLKNQNTHPQNDIELKVKVPHGTTLVDSYAGSPFTNRGKFDGSAVTWYKSSVKGESSEGPFVVIVRGKSWNPNHPETTLSTGAWVRWRGGEASSDLVILPNPLNPALAYATTAAGNHDAMAHAGYLDVSGNINDLRTQVANWEQGNDSGRRIGIEKVDRLEWIIPHVAWPAEMKTTISELHDALHPVEDALKEQDLAAAKEAAAKVGSISHDLTHAFYDKWATSIRAQGDAATIHTGYLDVSGNINDLRAQLAAWEKGNDSGRRIGIEKVDRLEAIIPHVDWPEQMGPTVSKLYVALAPVKASLRAENLDVTKEGVASIGSLSHDLTHAFYDKWMASLKSQGGGEMVHAGYLDVTGNINDLRSQIANWEQGNDSGRRIGIEKVDRLEWIIPHVAWPAEMKATISDLHEALHSVEDALKEQDLAAAKEAVAKVGSISHDLTHAFYDKWAAGQKTGQMPVAEAQPAATAMAPAEQMPMAPASQMPMAPAMPAASASLIAQGQQVYSSKGCAACHGTKGQGGVGPALTHWHEDTAIRSVVRGGEGMMPAFGSAQIGDDELAALIAFVQSLAGSR